MDVTMKDIFGIPVILPGEKTSLSMFTLGMFWAAWNGHRWCAYSFQLLPGFQAISILEGDNRAIWKPVFDRQQSLLRIKHWLDSPPTTTNLTSRLPTRLLHCEPNPGGTPRVRLIHTTGTDTSTQYSALSHRWGAVQPLMLLQSLVDIFTDNIPFESIPATFQDAINLTNDLGIEYIWIDSLCIIQDSKHDWQTEASDMASVYSQAYVTISAASAQDSTSGLKGQDSMLKHPCEITPSWVGFGEHIAPGPVRIIDSGAFCDQVLSQPLFRRGWVFQEWILSPKTIHVARDQLWWTSVSSMKHQGFASNETCDGYNFDVLQEYFHTVAPGTLYSTEEQSDVALQRVWHNFLQEYMSRSLTFESDRLVAFAGIAKAYQSYAKIPPHSYLAGLWRPALLESLLWFVSDGRKVSPPQNYRAPSWSWASVEPEPDSAGKFLIGNRDINFDMKEDEEPCMPTATVIDASVTTVGPEFGSVSDGYLILHGPLIQARLSMSMTDLTGRLTIEQAAEFVPGGRLRFVENTVSATNTAEGSAAYRKNHDGHTSLYLTMAQLDDVIPTTLAEEEVDIYLAVLYCRIRSNGSSGAEALALVRSTEKGEYRRIGYVPMADDIMFPWKKARDFGVFGTLADEQEYLSVGDEPGFYDYRIV
ncbi:hypothetical protein FHETE_3466 [Fusarium heterosporum]|uniref:Heterokaryon incompatibility domain-containing protein n=1 Tax=Fusarium heterosporum TaxID=42747 RepID=A0A8H5TRV4_FUSHE|nr:hypothetical protein FHETE_3466 [Fusarium heterosporum]